MQNDVVDIKFSTQSNDSYVYDNYKNSHMTVNVFVMFFDSL